MSISLNPKKFSAGTFLEEGVYEFTKCRWASNDYGGAASKPALVFETTLVDVDGEEKVQFWSAGDLSNFAPTEDGSDIVQVGQRATLSQSSNVYELLKSMLDAGFPEDKFDEIGSRANGYNGLRAYIILRDQKPRTGRGIEPAPVSTTGADGERKRQIPVVRSIERLPWEAPAAGTVPAAAPKPAAAPRPSSAPPAVAAPAPTPASAASSADEEELDNIASSIIFTVLGDNGGRVGRAKLVQPALNNPDYAAIRPGLMKRLSGNWAAERGLIKFEGTDAVLA